MSQGEVIAMGNIYTTASRAGSFADALHRHSRRRRQEDRQEVDTDEGFTGIHSIISNPYSYRHHTPILRFHRPCAVSPLPAGTSLVSASPLVPTLAPAPASLFSIFTAVVLFPRLSPALLSLFMNSADYVIQTRPSAFWVGYF